MGIFRKVMALALSVVMIASMSTTFVFAADTPETVPTPAATPTEPTATPTEPTATPTEPTATPTEPTATPTEPTATPAEPTATPTEPTATPAEPEVVTPMMATNRASNGSTKPNGWYNTQGLGISTVECDNRDTKAYIIKDNQQIQFGSNWADEFSVTPADAVTFEKETQSGFDVLVIKPKINSDSIVVSSTHIAETLTISAKNIPEPKPPIFTEVHEVRHGDIFLRMGTTKQKEPRPHAYAFPYAVIQVDTNTAPPTRTKLEITPTVTFAQTDGTPPIGGIESVLKANGENEFTFTPCHEGTYTVTFTYDCPVLKKQVTQVAKYIVKPPRGKNEIIPTDNTAAAIKTAIDGASPSTYQTETVIKLAENTTYTGDITLDKRVTIRGGVGTIINGSVLITAENTDQDNLAARLDNLILDGAGTTGKTGVAGSGDSYASIMDITIQNFAVGFDNTLTNYSFPFGGLILDANDVGLKLKPRRGQRQKTGGMKVQNNDVGVEIIAGNNSSPYAFELYDCDFINNTKHVKNSTGLSYNFSRNYYDGYDATANTLSGKFEGNVVYCPRYKDVIGTDPNKLIIDTDKLGNLPMENGKITNLDTANFTGKNVKLQMDAVARDGAATKKASWNFAAADSSLSATFDPNINTVLEATSDTAIGTIPAGTKYQPISFEHSGALPGTAEVSLVPDSGNAPNSDLKLYKVVGDALVLQAESPVTMRGGEYVFNRDTASDYVIQGTVVASSGGSDTSSGGSDDYVSSEDVSDKLSSSVAAGGTSVSVSVTGAPNVGMGAFEALRQNPGQTLVLRGDGYSWSIKGSDMLSPIAGLLAVNTTISGVSPNAEAIKAMTGDAVIQNLYFGYHGNLPFTATINVEVDPKLKGKSLNLYHIDGNLKNLMLMESGLVVKDGKVSFPVSSCSDYILTADTIPGATIGKKAIHNVTNPDTGAKDTVPLAVGIALMSVLGMAVLLKDDRKKK